jgi:hypothetical protein
MYGIHNGVASLSADGTELQKMPEMNRYDIIFIGHLAIHEQAEMLGFSFH